MKILLVQPGKPEKSIGGDDLAIYEPLALEYLAAGVNKHDVKILDMRIEKNFAAVLGSFNPDVVGITSYTVHVNVVKHLFEKIKKFNQKIFTIVGGHHATVVPEDFNSQYIDLIVLGEGFFIFKEIISRIEQNKALDGIPGTAYLKNNKFIINPNTVINDIDNLPFPNRELTKKYRNHYYSEWMKPLASIRTSKGCLFKCKFCALWKLTGGEYITRKPENIVRELAQIKEDFVFFADDESLLDTERMKILADLIKSSKIKKQYFLYARSDTIVKNIDLIKKWKEIGLKRVFVGFEFFRDEDLKFIKKGSTIKNNIDAIKILQSLDIDIFPSFIVRPEFDKKDFEEFRKYCSNLDLDFIGFSVLTPLPGTDFYNEVKDKLIINNYDYFDFIHPLLPTTLPIKEFYKEYLSLFNKTKSIPNQIAFIRKYPLKEIPALLKLYFKFNKQIKHAHNDYK